MFEELVVIGYISRIDMSSKKKDRILPLVVMLFLCVAAVLLSRTYFKVPAVAQDKTFDTEYTLVLSDYAGNQVHLYDYRRKVLIAYAWASWCPYCGAELQNLASLKKTYGDNIQVVAINRGESLETARNYSDHLTNTDGLVFLLDPNDAFFKGIGGYAMPETVFIDSGGTIIFHQRGPIQLPDVQAEIEKLLH